MCRLVLLLLVLIFSEIKRNGRSDWYNQGWWWSNLSPEGTKGNSNHCSKMILKKTWNSTFCVSRSPATMSWLWRAARRWTAPATGGGPSSSPWVGFLGRTWTSLLYISVYRQEGGDRGLGAGHCSDVPRPESQAHYLQRPRIRRPGPGPHPRGSHPPLRRRADDDSVNCKIIFIPNRNTFIVHFVDTIVLWYVAISYENKLSSKRPEPIPLVFWYF